MPINSHSLTDILNDVVSTGTTEGDFRGVTTSADDPVTDTDAAGLAAVIRQVDADDLAITALEGVVGTRPAGRAAAVDTLWETVVANETAIAANVTAIGAVQEGAVVLDGTATTLTADDNGMVYFATADTDLTFANNNTYTLVANMLAVYNDNMLYTSPAFTTQAGTAP